MYPARALLVATSLVAASAKAGEITPTVLVQGWGTVYDMDEDPQADGASYGDPEDDIGFGLYRARLGAQGTHDKLFFAMQVGTGAPYDALSQRVDVVTLYDAYAGVKWGGEKQTFKLSMGSVQIPLSREYLMSSRHLLFQERAVSTVWLSPNREIGLLADFAHESGVRARVGAFNGNGQIFQDTDPGLLTAARVEYGKGKTYQSFDPEGENAIGFGVAGQLNATAATTTVGFTADTLVRVGPITGIVAFGRNTISPTKDPVTAPDVQVDTTRWGGFAQISGYAPFEQGGLEIGARASLFDDAAQLQDNGDVAIVHAGATWRDPIPGLDVGGGYVMRLERNGAPASNDTVRLWAQIRYPFEDR
jgi:hypothetical protein